MKDLLFFVHSDHVFKLCFHKAKTPISMAPFSMIFLGEFSIAIYSRIGKNTLPLYISDYAGK